MSRADRCTWRYVSRRTGTAHAYEFRIEGSLCRRFMPPKRTQPTDPDESPVPLCLVCQSMLKEFRKYDKRKRR